MNITAHTEWFVHQNGTSKTLRSREEAMTEVQALAALPSGELSVLADAGQRPLWQRIFGLDRYIVFYFTLYWHDEHASLIFFDLDANELRTSSPKDAPITDPAFAKKHPGAAAPLITRQQAFSAIEEFLKSGQRPDWLTYQVVG